MWQRQPLRALICINRDASPVRLRRSSAFRWTGNCFQVAQRWDRSIPLWRVPSLGTRFFLRAQRYRRRQTRALRETWRPTWQNGRSGVPGSPGVAVVQRSCLGLQLINQRLDTVAGHWADLVVEFLAQRLGLRAQLGCSCHGFPHQWKGKHRSNRRTYATGSQSAGAVIARTDHTSSVRRVRNRAPVNGNPAGFSNERPRASPLKV